MKILITGGTSATALKLCNALSGHQIILGDYGQVPNIKSAAYTMVSLGDKNEETIAHNLLNCCLDNEVDAILPLQNFEIEPLSKSEVLFQEFNIKLLLPNRDILNAYFSINEIHKSINYTIYIDGEITFSTVDENLLIMHGRGENLNGAFYFNDDKLQLITI